MKLFVSNISPETQEEDLRQSFSEFGEVVSVKIVIDHETGMPRGFGFVEMGDKFQCYDAIDNLDATYMKGNIISVKMANANKPQQRSGGGGGFNRNRNNNNSSSQDPQKRRFNKRF
jgi:RNA recognition motif-containing protein